MAENKKIFKTLKKYKKELEKLGYKVIYIGLYGSQNYNLDDEESDIDAKAIVELTFENFINKEIISKVIDFEEGSVDVKDIFTFNDVAKRGNIAYLEAIQTQYYIGDKDIKQRFSNYEINLKSIYGQAIDKRHALTHEYPSKTKEFEKWGFDPKQWHHIHRLMMLLNSNEGFGKKTAYNVFDGEDRNRLIAIKRNSNNVKLKDVEEECDKILEWMHKFLQVHNYHFDINKNKDYWVHDYIKKSIKKQLIKEQYDSVREFRTFDNPIPKQDLDTFPILEKYKGKDIRYTIYMNIEVEE